MLALFRSCKWQNDAIPDTGVLSIDVFAVNLLR
jgi:hypothetical protein